MHVTQDTRRRARSASRYALRVSAPAEPIRSSSNALLKRVRAAAAGRGEGELLLEGDRLVDEALRARLELDAVLVSGDRPERLAELARAGAAPRAVVPELLAAAGSLESASGCLALARRPRALGLADVPARRRRAGRRRGGNPGPRQPRRARAHGRGRGRGGAARRALNATLVANGDVTSDFEITPDGTRVVYVATQDDQNDRELYVVPIDGSAAPTKLNGTLTSGGNVSNGTVGEPAFWIAPDSGRVAYLADQDVAQQFELYSVPLDASSAAVQLSPALGPNEDVRKDVALAPLGGRVAFRADKSLYFAPLDGSAAAVRLNPAFDVTRSVESFALSSDGERAVYRSDQTVNDAFQLHSAPLDGSAADVQLTTAGADEGYRTSADGALVFYIDGDLHVVPADGSASPLRLSRALPGFVCRSFDLGAGFVVYVAGEDSPTVNELYQLFLSRPFRRGAAGASVVR